MQERGCPQYYFHRTGLAIFDHGTESGKEVLTPGFKTSYSQLPATLPVFPLNGVLLLPNGRLPLNIFEARYLSMTDDALASDRLIGMIQPTAGHTNAQVPELYPTGCAGRITQFMETSDGRYSITLTGVARFDIGQEIDSMRGYRRVVPDWTRYRDDFEPAADPHFDRDHLLGVLKLYFSNNGIEADWEAIERTEGSRLITTLAMICPFDPPEKQALLLAEASEERAKTMIALMEMANHLTNGRDDAKH